MRRNRRMFGNYVLDIADLLGSNTFVDNIEEPGAISYREFVNRYFKAHPGELKSDNEEVRKKAEEKEAENATLLADFLKPGHPGVKLKSDYDRIIRNLVELLF